MITLIDSAPNRITMYRLVLYYLIFLVLAAAALSSFGFLSFRPLDLLASVSVLVFVCWIANSALAKIFSVPANAESLYITAFILALIIAPQPHSRYFTGGSAFVVWAGVLAMASKYVLAIRRKHIFNPAAFAVALSALTLNQAAQPDAASTALLIPPAFRLPRRARPPLGYFAETSRAANRSLALV